MQVIITSDDNSMTVKVTGRIDTNTAPELQDKVRDAYNGQKTLRFDFTDLEYISSAGLRVLLTFNKWTSKGKDVAIYNPNEAVEEILSVTGFIDIMKIEYEKEQIR